MVTQTYPTFDPTSLIAGSSDVIHRSVLYASGAAIIPRGSLMGRVSGGGAAASPSPKAGNTGNATVTMDGTAPVGAGAESGVYRIVWSDATHYTVYDPTGDTLGSSTNSAGFNDEIKFAVAAGGTAMVNGDEIDVTVSVVDKYIPSKANATDGSQVPVGVSAADVDVTGGDAIGPMYTHGEFAAEMMTIDPTWSISGVQAVLRQNNANFYVRSLGSLG